MLKFVLSEHANDTWVTDFAARTHCTMRIACPFKQSSSVICIALMHWHLQQSCSEICSGQSNARRNSSRHCEVHEAEGTQRDYTGAIVQEAEEKGLHENPQGAIHGISDCGHARNLNAEKNRRRRQIHFESIVDRPVRKYPYGYYSAVVAFPAFYISSMYSIWHFQRLGRE